MEPLDFLPHVTNLIFAACYFFLLELPSIRDFWLSLSEYIFKWEDKSEFESSANIMRRFGGDSDSDRTIRAIFEFLFEIALRVIQCLIKHVQPRLNCFVKQ